MKKIIIKRHRNRNDYLLTDDGLWVRNFTKPVRAIDINALVGEKDYQTLIHNQMQNIASNLPNIDAETISVPNLIIVSDGYQFEEKQKLLSTIKGKVTIVGVNRSLPKWHIDKKMDYYVVNNPYKECMSYLPEDYFPRCIASIRTYPNFIRNYQGVIYQYVPTPNERFYNMIQPSICSIDDYRNPICAAIGLASRWQVKKILLFCCDDAFEGERPSSEKLPNGLYFYPQHSISHNLVEGNLFWLANKSKNIRLGNYSSGPEFNHIPYIREEELINFFER